MTKYARALIDYVMQNKRCDEVAASAFCDEFLDPLWRMMDRQPEATPVVIVLTKEEMADE
jgi:hypothetical protein